MNTVDPNIDVLERFDPANIMDSLNVIAEDAVFHCFKHRLPDMESDYHGRTGFMEYFEKIANESKGTFDVIPISMTPMCDMLVVTHVKDNKDLMGKHLEIDAVVVWRILDWKIIESWDIPVVNSERVSDI